MGKWRRKGTKEEGSSDNLRSTSFFVPALSSFQMVPVADVGRRRLLSIYSEGSSQRSSFAFRALRSFLMAKKERETPAVFDAVLHQLEG
jgi:hypothetical protein